MVKVLKQIGLYSLIVSALTVFGLSINYLLDYTYVTNFFVVIIHYSYLFDFCWNMWLTWTFVGFIFAVEVALASVKVILWLNLFFHKD